VAVFNIKHDKVPLPRQTVSRALCRTERQKCVSKPQIHVRLFLHIYRMP